MGITRLTPPPRNLDLQQTQVYPTVLIAPAIIDINKSESCLARASRSIPKWYDDARAGHDKDNKTT
jgi:hypothetical protein